jgi:hypothetical protein
MKRQRIRHRLYGEPAKYLETITPIGKPLGQCTREELEAIAKKFTELGL